MKRRLRSLATVALVTLALGAVAVWLIHGRLARRIGIRPPSGAPGVTSLELSPGFSATVFADGLLAPRFMAVSPDGVLFVAERDGNRVTALPDANADDRADGTVLVADGLHAPSSLAFLPGTRQLFVGETDRVTRFDVAGTQAVARRVVIDDLPTGGNHTTRTVQFGADGHLYVSIGSSCNVCLEADRRRATVMVFDADGGNPRIFMSGLRNAVGLAQDPATGTLWATNNGRDLMGNDVPPDGLYRLEAGADAGWPRCHAGDIPDPEFGGSDPCAGVASPALRIPAHSAPLGLAFYNGTAFGDAYTGDLFIAYHGSWNRYPPTGYKVVHLDMKAGLPQGPAEDFATGWLAPDWNSAGRPAGLAVAADGALMVSDDKAGIIYRIARTD
jgi:glucose/arabinose dehydrogenase